MNPIYVPKGRAKEYGDYALNIYTGCPHRCYYCFAPNVLHKNKEVFHSLVEPRKDIVESTKKQLEKDGIKGKLIHLCFTCDPYPKGYDTSVTREIIKVIKESGNHVQILTKNDCTRDFDLLDKHDWFGVTVSGDMNAEPNAAPPLYRFHALDEAHKRGINTWISFEPVLDAKKVLMIINNWSGIVDKIKIGKLNYYPSDINWGEFGIEVEELCRKLKVDFYIKESLRVEMDRLIAKQIAERERGD